MGVPKSILDVERPYGTIVMDSRNIGPKRWIVRARSKYVESSEIPVRMNQVIGHINDGKFIPVLKLNNNIEPDSVSYGASAYAIKFTDDIRDDLFKCFPINDSYTILATAILKVIKPGISNSKLQSAYKSTALQTFFPGIHISKNTVGKVLDVIGMNGKNRQEFMRLRLERVASINHIAIDGTLVQDTSTINDLSKWSYKGKSKKHKEVSIVFAFDIEKMEPICSTVYPGNCNDASIFADFIEKNGINKGVIIADKGFPPGKVRQFFKQYSELSHISPLKRNDKRIDTYHMLAFKNTLLNTNRPVLYNKVKVSEDIFLYSFKDLTREYAEKINLYSDIQRKQDGVIADTKTEENVMDFGTITLESDLDLDPEIVYVAFQNRWVIETAIRQYKSVLCLDETGVQSNYRVWGEEFINMLASTITCRIIEDLRKKGILNKMTFEDVMGKLSSLWRESDAPSPKWGDKHWHVNVEATFELANTLGIFKEGKPKKEPKKRGRPKKTKPEPTEKRPRGRPRKIIENPVPKRPRGRPRKIIENPVPKRPRGRPRKIIENPVPKRPRGRPRKK